MNEKNNTCNSIKGMAILGIVLVHFSQYFHIGGIFAELGQHGVQAFL